MQHTTSQKVGSAIVSQSFLQSDFLVVVNVASNFANITLSSLYFDITKDCLYADSRDSRERRAVVTVLEQVSLGHCAYIN
jgi:isoleucyl-tRNA synthetase